MVLKEVNYDLNDGFTITRKFVFGDRRYGQYDFPNDEEIILSFFGDWHVGCPSSRLDYIEKEIDFIKNTDNSYMIGMGDYIDIAREKHGGGQIREETMTPDEQIDWVVRHLLPIKHKILGLHGGNHELRMYRQDIPYDVMRHICRELGVPFLKWESTHKVRVGNNNYDMFTTHGSGGARYVQTKLTRIEKILTENYFGIPIAVMGHVHALGHRTKWKRGHNHRNKCQQKIKVLYALSGHFLERDDTYAELDNMPETPPGVLRIKLSGGDFKFTVQEVWFNEE